MPTWTRSWRTTLMRSRLKHARRDCPLTTPVPPLAERWADSTQVQDAYRDQLRIPFVDTIWQDVRYGCRVLRRNPGFSAVALSILAIGIASATTIFSFVDAVLLKPLPYENGDRIVRILERRPDGATSWISTRAYLDWRSDNTSSNRWRCSNRVWSRSPAHRRRAAASGRASRPDYFDVFGVRPVLGRTFAEGEDTPGRSTSSC